MKIIEIGGSMFDLGVEFIKPLCLEIMRLSNTGLYDQFIITVGGGPAHDVIKDLKDEYSLPEHVYDHMTAYSLIINEILIKQYLNHEIIFPSSACHSKSDLQCLRIAEHHGCEEVIFIKDSKGIFDHDPNDLKQQDNNPMFFPRIDIKNFEDLVDRTGSDGRGDHLIEDSALEFFKKSEIIKTIRFLDGCDVLCLSKYFNDEDPGSVLYK